jgi:ubiquinone/menaquinone biosynthesis C-methylase UbiE
MRAEDYELMHTLESDFWWFVGMRQITGSLLHRYLRTHPQEILDVGCGTGINLLSVAGLFRPDKMIG